MLFIQKSNFERAKAFFHTIDSVLSFELYTIKKMIFNLENLMSEGKWNQNYRG